MNIDKIKNDYFNDEKIENLKIKRSKYQKGYEYIDNMIYIKTLIKEVLTSILKTTYGICNNGIWYVGGKIIKETDNNFSQKDKYEINFFNEYLRNSGIKSIVKFEDKKAIIFFELKLDEKNQIDDLLNKENNITIERTLNKYSNSK